MHCKKATQLLQLYIDGRLTMEETRALEAHIARCAACREELELLQEVAYALRDLRLIAEPEDLKTKIMRRIAMTPARSDIARFSALRPSLPQLLAVILLATFEIGRASCR